ncbi:MAG: inosine/xanthosine triphosphatase [Thermoplasmata archaeon]|nr:inosine/xanthosine triphosphatase [Thermoplasmata archaeon]
MKVCLGGTFDMFHQGHKALLDKAFSLGGQVLIGLTSHNFAKVSRKSVNTFNMRKRRLDDYLKKKKYRKYEIVEIDNPYGPSVELKGLDTIVVSEGTESRAKEINNLRAKKRFKSLKIIKVAHVLAEDCVPISSRRIRAKEIDVNGRMLKPIVVSLGSENRNKLKATRKVFSALFKKSKYKTVKVRTSVPEQPFERDTVKGAIERAKKALSMGGGDFGVGIEAGLLWSPLAKLYFDVQYCAVIDKLGRITIGHGSGFCYPRAIIDNVKKGLDISKAMESATGIKNIGDKMGAIGYLSKGRLNRDGLTEQAVLMALVPRMRRELYF